MIYNPFFTKQKVGVKERLLLINKLINLHVSENNSITKNCLLLLSFVTSSIRLLYPILLVTLTLQSIAFSGFSKDSAPQKELLNSQKGRFEIHNLSAMSKEHSIVSESLKETEQLLNDYSKVNHDVDANILDKIRVTFLSATQMNGALGAFSAVGTTEKPEVC